MSVAKNVASNTSALSAAGGGASKASSAAAAITTANGAARATNGDTPKTDQGESNGGVEVTPLEVSPSDQAKTTAKSDATAPSRKSSFLLNIGGKQSPERGVTDKRAFGAGGPAAVDRRASAGGAPSSRGSSPANAPSGGSGPIGAGKKKSSE